jgi:hypothetical protein
MRAHNLLELLVRDHNLNTLFTCYISPLLVVPFVVPLRCGDLHAFCTLGIAVSRTFQILWIIILSFGIHQLPEPSINTVQILLEVLLQNVPRTSMKLLEHSTEPFCLAPMSPLNHMMQLWQTVNYCATRTISTLPRRLPNCPVLGLVVPCSTQHSIHCWPPPIFKWPA